MVNRYVDKFDELKIEAVSRNTRDVIDYYTLKEIITNERYVELKKEPQ